MADAFDLDRGIQGHRAVVMRRREDADDIDAFVGQDRADVLEQPDTVPSLNLDRHRECRLAVVAPGGRDQSLRFRNVDHVRTVHPVDGDASTTRDKSDNGIAIGRQQVARFVGDGRLHRL